MATRKNTARRPRRASFDLYDVLGQVAEAQAVLECAYASLADSDDNGNESVCMRVGMEMLRAAYTAFDQALVSVPDPSDA